MADIFVVLAILLAFVPLSALLFRGITAYLFSPAVSAFAALVAGILHVLLDLGVLPIWLVLVALQLPALLIPKARTEIKKSLTVSASDVRSISLLAVSLVLVLVTLITTPAPLKWDARSIWFLHAAWLNGPALYFREAQFLPAGSWPDYPILGPSLMTVANQVTGGEANLWLSSRIVGVLAMLLAVWTVVTLLQVLRPRIHPAFSVLITLAFGLAFTVLADGYFNAGYMDALQAVSVVALFASVIVLADKPKIVQLIAPAVLLFVAANVKQEGFWFAFGVLGLGIIYQISRRNLAPLILIPIAVAARFIWSAFQEHLKMPDNGHTAEVIDRLPLLISGDGAIIANLNLIWSSWGQPRSFGYLALAFAASLVVVILLPKEKGWNLRFVLPAILISAPVGVLTVAILTYALGQSGGLEWWLGTSYTRITATFEALALLAVTVAAMLLAPEVITKTSKIEKPMSKKAKKRARR